MSPPSTIIGVVKKSSMTRILSVVSDCHKGSKSRNAISGRLRMKRFGCSAQPQSGEMFIDRTTLNDPSSVRSEMFSLSPINGFGGILRAGCYKHLVPTALGKKLSARRDFQF